MNFDPIWRFFMNFPGANRALLGEGRGTILSLVALGWLLVLGTRLVIPALLPQISADFGISKTAAGFAISLIWFTYATVQFPAGLLTDRFGETRLILASLFLGSVGVLALSLAPGFALFLGACVLFGIGTGFYGPPRVTLLSRLYPRNDGSAIGIMFAAGNIGTSVLPLAIGWLAVQYGWRMGMQFLVPLFLVTLTGFWWLVASRISAAETNSSSPNTAFRWILSSVNDRSVIVLGSATTLTIFVFQGFTAFFPTYLIAIKGLNHGTAATLFGAFFATGIIVQPLAGGTADRIGYRRLLLGLSVVTAGLLVVLPFVEGMVPLSLLSVLLGVRAGIDPVNNAFLVKLLPPGVQGSSFGLLRTMYLGLGATGSFVVGVFADFNRFDEAFLFLAALTVLSFGLYYALPDSQRLDAN